MEAPKHRNPRSKRKKPEPSPKKKKKIKLKYFNKHGSSPEQPTSSDLKQATVNQLKRVDNYKLTREKAQLFKNQQLK